jgi:hypothetical protein
MLMNRRGIVFAMRKPGLNLVDAVTLTHLIIHPMERVPDDPGMRGMETVTTFPMQHYHSYPTRLSSNLICTRTSLRTSPFRAKITTLKVDLRVAHDESNSHFGSESYAPSQNMFQNTNKRGLTEKEALPGEV